MHRVVRWSLLTLVSLLFLALLVCVLLLFPVVQTWIAGQVSASLSKSLGITVRIERVEIRPFGPNRLHKVFVADLHGDTLLAADELWIRGLRFSTEKHSVELRKLELHDARFRLEKATEDAHSNLTNLLAKLASDDTTSGGAEWTVLCGDLDVERLHFSFNDRNVAPLPFGVDFDHVDVNTADVIGSDVRVAGDSILVQLERISLKDRSGLVLEELSGNTKVSPRGIRIRGMRIKTPGSDLRGNLAFRTNGFGDYDNFESDVRLRVELDSSRLQFSDVALFAPDLQGVDFPIRLAGRFRGTINELKARDLDLDFGRGSHFLGDVEMSGLPDVPNTFMVIDVRECHTDPADLEGLPVPPFIAKGTLNLPDEVKRLGAMSFAGNFTGFTRSFTAYGRANTAAGSLRTDITYERDTLTRIFQLNGKLATEGFDLGRLIGDHTMGVLACDVQVKASGKDINSLKAELDGTVPLINVDKLGFTGLTVKGKLEKNLFNGELHSTDPKAQFDFEGLADLRGRWPIVDFSADVQHLDPRALGLIGGDRYSSVMLSVRAKGELAPDSLKGSIHLENVTYCDDSCELVIGDLDLSSTRVNGQPVLDLKSDIADVQVRGPFYPTQLPQAVHSVLYSVFPALQSQVKYDQEEQNFTFDARVKNAQPFLNIAVPGLRLDSGLVASGSFDSRTFDLGLSATIPFFRYGAVRGDSVEVIVDKTLDVLAFRFRSQRQQLNATTFISGIDLTGKAYQDEMQLRAGWTGSSNGTSGDLRLNALVLNPHAVSVDLEPSQLFFGRGAWSNERTAHIDIDTSSITIDSLELRNEGQYVMLDGVISKDPTSALDFDIRKLRLENALPFYTGPALHGSVDGDGRLLGLYKTPYLLSYLCVDSLAVDDHPVGDLRFSASWNEEQNGIDVSGVLQRDTLQALQFDGQLNPGKEKELDVRLAMDHLDLRFVDPYLPKGISDIRGTVTGAIDVTGKLASPNIKGTALMEEAGLRIDYLNTAYTFTHRINIEPDMFTLDLVELHDEEGNEATAIGTIIHHGLKDWNFDVSVAMEHLMVLNTDQSQNHTYYGKAYGTGDLSVGGYADNLELTVNARTGRGTDIHFPLGASTEVGSIPFIRFVSAGANGDSLEQPVDLSGIHLDMNVEVTPNATFELIFDPTVGDIMRGSGQGNIAMTVTPSGDFSMKGAVEITEGDYLFTLRNLVAKKFILDPGGRIMWFGDPFDAQINLNAVYKLRTSLYDILPERSESSRKRVPVEVGMHLTDKLLNPDIDFEVRLPSVDEGTRTQVNTLLSNKDNMNKQVFSLIVLNRFVPDAISTSGSGSFIADAGASGATTLSEFASSQVSNAVNKLVEGVDVGVNYRPGSTITPDEWEVALGTQFFNDRVQVSTNVGVATGATTAQNGNQFIGDFSAEYLITHDGKLRLKAFSQSNDRNLNQLDQAPTTQGVGLAYREDFNTWGEFWKRFSNVFRRKDHQIDVD